MSSIKIIQTEDGSQSLYHEELRETYHSTHGALTESRYVFLEKGLQYLVDQGVKNIQMLEVGFGTGLNALLTFEYALNNPDVQVDYHTLEPFPLTEGIVANLSYEQLLPQNIERDHFDLLHRVDWEKPQTLRENFKLTKYKTSLQDFSSTDRFNLIFYDAFAPSKQSDFWEFEVLEHLSSLTDNTCVFVTYCAKGQLKRDLKSLDFKVETLDGPPGKKEMVRAIKGF